MSVIEASSGTYRSRVDGTIVLSVEIEPRFRAEALALFGMPGTPMALAGLKTQKADAPKRTVGPYCWQAIDLCRAPMFWKWIGIASMGQKEATSEAEAAAVIRRVCKVESRNEFDTNDDALARFRKMVQDPYRKWLEKQEATA